MPSYPHPRDAWQKLSRDDATEKLRQLLVEQQKIKTGGPTGCQVCSTQKPSDELQLMVRVTREGATETKLVCFPCIMSSRSILRLT